MRSPTFPQPLGDAKALAVCRGDLSRSILALLTHSAARALADNWVFALVSAAVTCALCVATIPLWPQIGMGGAGYHLLRLAIIGLVLGCIPRASTLSCIFLLVLIGASDWTIAARETRSGWHVFAERSTYFFVLQDGIIMASMLIVLRIVKLTRMFSSRAG